jgi:hypothetical protein
MATSRRGRRNKGPKGYQRSDERIKEDLCERLSHHPNLDPSEIEVEVSSGEVTLKGEVDERHEKWMAEECAYEVSGVTEVNNQLRTSRRSQESSRESDGSQRERSTSASSGSSSMTSRGSSGSGSQRSRSGSSSGTATE